MAHFEVRGKGHPIECKCGTIWRVPSNCRRAPFMVDQRWRTARDQRQFQRWMLDNISQAHAWLAYSSQLECMSHFIGLPYFSQLECMSHCIGLTYSSQLECVSHSIRRIIRVYRKLGILESWQSRIFSKILVLWLDKSRWQMGPIKQVFCRPILTPWISWQWPW